MSHNPMSVTEDVQAAASQARHAARKAHPLLEPLARLGYAAKGLIYGLIGWLALMAAGGNGGKATDQLGAIDTIATYPLGAAVLYVLGVGLLGYAAWRLAMGVFNPEQRPWIKRIAYTVTGLAYAGVGIAAFDAAGGSRTQRNEDGRVAQMMAAPFGRFIVASVGLIFIGAGFVQIATGLKGKFRSVLKIGEMGEAEERTVMIAGRIGLVARGLAFVMIGCFLLWADLTNDPDEAGGLDEALRTIAGAPYGPYLLGAAGLGLIAYGVFMLFEARYRRITPA